MTSPRTVSDTKRAFYTLYTRPINSIYRRVVDELMVEIHLLSVNVDFYYDPIFALGVVTTFNRFMLGYQPDRESTSIFNSLCTALNDDPVRFLQDAETLQTLCSHTSVEALTSTLTGTESPEGQDITVLRKVIEQITLRTKFKYSRLFGIGLFTLLELTDADFVKDDTKRDEVLSKVASALRFNDDKLQKDLELYCANLEKMSQARLAIEEAVQSERKKRSQRLQEKAGSDQAENTPVHDTET